MVAIGSEFPVRAQSLKGLFFENGVITFDIVNHFR